MLVNEYDGVDLPDDKCRVLILDQLPKGSNLYQQYFQSALSKSNFHLRSIAQKIEQGMGRGIRGQSDYCIVLVFDTEMTNFILQANKQDFFSNEMRQQLVIGEIIQKSMSDDISTSNDYLKTLEKLLNDVLERDENWKSLYRLKMEDVSIKNPSKQFIEQAVSEKMAEDKQ